jgi:hypothetical protein
MDIEKLVDWLSDASKKYSFKMDKDIFPSGAAMVDIFIGGRLIVIEIKKDTIGLSEVKSVTDGFTLPDEIFTEEEKFKVAFIRLMEEV